MVVLVVGAISLCTAQPLSLFMEVSESICNVAFIDKIHDQRKNTECNNLRVKAISLNVALLYRLACHLVCQV